MAWSLLEELHPRWTTSIILFLFPALVLAAIDLDQCNSPLGMHSGAIKDENINASSSHSVSNVGPQNARLNREMNGGAWCPKRQISKGVFEYLEITLDSVHVVTEVATQGRFGNGQGLEYAEMYMLEYWRPGLPNWIRFRNRHTQEIFEGNTNTYSVVKRKLDPVIIATKLRFIPHSIHERTVCMRVEAYGCPWSDGLMSYSMPQGERRGVDIDLADMSYDGIKDDSYLHGGLGQLTDGVTGDDNFRTDVSGLGKGYEWVGWKNDSSFPNPVTMTFEFDTVRNFSSAYFFCNNMYPKEVEVFSSAKIWFSVGGKYFYEQPISFSYMPDRFFERARDVTIHLYHRVGRFVKAELYFAARWILISEISFSSVPAYGNFTEEEPPPAPPIVSTAMNEDALTNEYVGLVIGVLAAVILLLIVVICVIVVRNKRRKYNSSHSILKPVDSRVTVSMKDLELTYSHCPPLICHQNGSLYSQHTIVAESDKMVYQEPRDYKVSYEGMYSNASTTSREYAVPDVTKTSNPRPYGPTPVTPVPKPSFPQTLPKPPQEPPPEQYYATTDITKLPSIQGVSGNNTYSVPNVDILNTEDVPLKEIPRHKLQYIEKIGEGQFGEVHLCKVEGILESVDIPICGDKTLVAVKTLRNVTDEQPKKDFFKEAKILSRLRDKNIVRLIGVCTEGDPLCMVVEYMEHGDLNQFLQRCDPEYAFTSSSNHSASTALSYGALIFIATQIASGMKYLESLNFVHRDLAARNCLVGKSLAIKIADFGMSRDLYSGDYYKLEGRAMLPIRWMSWECILLGKFTTKSDVWSFGVTLWELLTFAKSQPFPALSDDQVIENVSHFFHEDGKQIYLPQPVGCPKEIYDLMMECWQRKEQKRPNFKEIHIFLQRKNEGYTPRA